MSNKKNNKKVSKTAAQDMEDAYQMESGYNLAMINEELLTPENRKKLELMQDFIPESAGKKAGRKLYKQRKSKNREAQTDNEKQLKAALKLIAQNRKNKKKPTPPKVPTIKPKPGPHKVRPEGYQPPKIKKRTGPKSEFERWLEETQPKKYGGKINYRMGGGQVVDSSYD